MNTFMKTALLLGFLLTCFMGPQTLYAQQCQDEEGITKDYLKDLNDIVDAVKKESLDDFERNYHQKATLTKLGLTLGMVKELVECLDKATLDPSAPKDQMDSYKARHESYSKIATKLEADRKALKEAGDPKPAKALIEKFDYTT